MGSLWGFTFETVQLQSHPPIQNIWGFTFALLSTPSPQHCIASHNIEHAHRVFEINTILRGERIIRDSNIIRILEAEY